MKAITLNRLPLAKPRLSFIEPMYALPVNELPEGNEWLYEIKLDGYRCLAGRDASGPVLWSRRGNSFLADFPNIAGACEKLDPGTLIDGEIIALDEAGRVSFNLLQHRRSKAQALQFYAFDLLIYRGRSLLNLRLERRRELLVDALRAATSPIRLLETLEANAADLIHAAKQLGFEGIIAKRKDSLYEPGKRSGAWMKYKINQGQEFVIGGYTPGNPFDALIVGYYEDAKLYYVAKVRNGFVPLVRREVYRRLKGLEIETCPFANLPEKRRTPWALTNEEMKKCLWLRPDLVAQVEFTEWTPDGHLRQATFVGLRDDKDPLDVRREGR